jgi:hypothetical protein
MLPVELNEDHYTSCSCECGPLDEPCNEQGPGSKVRFSFRKEEISR